MRGLIGINNIDKVIREKISSPIYEAGRSLSRITSQVFALSNEMRTIRNDLKLKKLKKESSGVSKTGKSRA